LYVGGNFTKAGGKSANNIAEWNGSVWSSLSSGTNGTVSALASFNSSLYVGGQFTTAGGSPAKHIASWNGTTWATVGTGFNNTVLALAVYNTTLYAGGTFDSAGSAVVNHIASLSVPTAINSVAADNSVNVYPNPSNGNFSVELGIKNYELGTKDKIEIYNVLGVQVLPTFVIPNSQFVIDLTGHPAGIYIYRILTEEGELITTGRMVVR
ncbi:MAG TPA: T9SS type A sorting domain-containing protein, partial [Bacteroidia bacterium]|nr:T9SS type A sorting domain-containing protein [Bacteroidia bacterium]